MTKQDIIDIYGKFYELDSQTFKIVFRHCELVAEYAREIAEKVGADAQLVWEAAMLHDIGLIQCDAPALGAYGMHPYLYHGYAGAQMLREAGLSEAYQRVCDRHTGVGLTVEDHKAQNFPGPERDMMPETLEEQIICFADNFYSKNPEYIEQRKTVEQIRQSVAKFGEDKLARFDDWCQIFL